MKITKLDTSEVEIEGEISVKKVEATRSTAIKHLAEHITIPGFRKGHIPENVLIKHVGEMAILEEAAQIALEEAYPSIITENKIDAIGRPSVTITKLAAGNPLGFKIKTAVMPEIKLANYKKIAKTETGKKTGAIEVTDKEVDEVLTQIRTSKAHEAHAHDERQGDQPHDHSHDLPELNDEFAKSLGQFKDVADLKEKVKENLKHEKEYAEKEKKRLALVEALVAESTITLPEIMIEGELEKMLAQFKDDIIRMNFKYEDYLKHVKKTEADLRKEWRENAIKKGKLQLILNAIAKEEGIKPTEDEIKKEMDLILEHYKDAERFRVRMYVETFLTNDKVFKFLESQS